jgi:hypothetical protein
MHKVLFVGGLDTYNSSHKKNFDGIDGYVIEQMDNVWIRQNGQTPKPKDFTEYLNRMLRDEDPKFDALIFSSKYAKTIHQLAKKYIENVAKILLIPTDEHLPESRGAETARISLAHMPDFQKNLKKTLDMYCN